MKAYTANGVGVWKKLTASAMTIFEDLNGGFSVNIAGAWAPLEKRFVPYNDEPIPGQFAVYTLHNPEGEIVAFIDGNDDYREINGVIMGKTYQTHS